MQLTVIDFIFDVMCCVISDVQCQLATKVEKPHQSRKQ